MSEHPFVSKFRSALKQGPVTPQKKSDFNRWRNNPEKCKGEDKAEADRLWAQCESGGRSVSAGVNAGAIRAPAGFGGQRADNTSAGEPAVLGEAFHNPYTFIPFPAQAPHRHAPTPLTIDEIEKDRFTGIIDLEVKLLSPLMTNSPEPVREAGGHRTFGVLAIGEDVIVPATGVRGALRTLMSILTGGTLGYVDEEAWLCQGRDAKLGPAGKVTHGKEPEHAFLAEVVRPGGVGRDGVVQLGRTILVKADDIDQLAQRCRIINLPRPRPGQQTEHLWTDEGLTSLVNRYDEKHPWKIKLSGRPINRKGKREGLFLAAGSEITLPAGMWSAYAGRNRHGDHPELRKGDLVWLEPKSFELETISAAVDVKSIQWARWGREGERLLDVVAKRHSGQLPDAFNPDGKVDEVTDLFGQVPRKDMADEIPSYKDWKARKLSGPAPSFAARVRPGNLVFKGAKKKVQSVALAPLAPPHPGCAAFYRDTGSDLVNAADTVGNHNLPLRGYKVFRTTTERGELAPWKFTVQGVYNNKGTLNPPQQRVNKTCDLLPEDGAPLGCLRITVRAMNQRELMVLLAACAVDWRLGGGKPLGLGLCRATSVTLREFCDNGSLGVPVCMKRDGDAIAILPQSFAGELATDKELVKRMGLWQASQAPVAKLRYPRAVNENRNGKSRGGHVWFQRHAQPRKAVREGEHPKGLQVLHIAGDLAAKANAKALRAQPLPLFDQANPQADALYGHDLIAGEGPEWSEQTQDRRTLYKKLEPFDPARHARTGDQSGGNQGQNRDRRQNDRSRR